MNRKLTIIELSELVANKAQTTHRMSELFLKELFATVSQELAEGRGVEIKGLGSFVMPTAMTDEEDPTIEFAPAQSIQDAVNQPFAQFEPVELSDDLTEEELRVLTAVDGSAQGTEVEATQGVVGEVFGIEELPIMEEPPVIDEPPVMEKPPVMEEPPVIETSSMVEEPPVLPVMEPSKEAESEEEVPIDKSAEDEVAEPVVADADKAVTEAAEALPEEVTETVPEETTEALPEEETGTPEPIAEDETRRVAKRSMLKGIVVGALGALLLTSLLWILFGPRGAVTGSTTPSADTLVAEKTTTAGKEATPSVFKANKPQPAEPKKDIPVIRDTVTAKRPLTVIARKHYGNEFFYVYIYEENKDRIKDVNNIAPGTEVIIPLASKYGFDPKDPECVKQAQLKSMELNRAKK